MECEKAWLDWVIARSPLKPVYQDAVLRRVADFLDAAPPETLIPLMTRCRPLPEIFRLMRAYRCEGIAGEDVRVFFSSAPRDVRNAFDTIRRETM